MDVDQEGGGIQIDAEPDVSLGNKNVSPNEKKRKRVYTDEELREWERIVKRKLEDESDRVDTEEDHNESSNRELYALFNDLQGIQADFNIRFSAPELVVVGGQSDGKCTLSISVGILSPKLTASYSKLCGGTSWFPIQHRGQWHRN
jgi:hypothetical protein